VLDHHGVHLAEWLLLITVSMVLVVWMLPARDWPSGWRAGRFWSAHTLLEGYLYAAVVGSW
jgi:hypothetical protein